MPRPGAKLSVLGSTSAAGNLKDTAGQWQYVELYRRTGPQQKSLAVLLRLGFYCSLATGVAIFDDAKLEEVRELPQGARSISFGDNSAAEVFPVVTAEQAPPEPPKTQPASSGLTGGMPWAIVLVLAVLAAATGLIAAMVVLALVRVGRVPTTHAGRRGERITIESLIARDREASRRPHVR